MQSLIRAIRREVLWYCVKRKREVGSIGLISALLFFAMVAATPHHKLGTRRLKPSDLPEYAIASIEALESLSLATAIAGTAIFVWLGRHRPPQANIGLTHFLSVPEQMNETFYYISMPDGPAGLKPFVEMSDDEIAIALRHTELRGSTRSTLYERWQGWRRDAFLVLFKRGEKGGWRAVSVSIAIPLTAKGVEFVLSGGGSAVDLEREHFCDSAQPARALLIDTWIVEAKGSHTGQEKKPRKQTDKHAPALILIHIGLLVPEGCPADIIVEADNKQLDRLLRRFGFISPPSPQVVNQHRLIRHTEIGLREDLLRIAATIERLRSWPIRHIRG